MFIDAFTGKLLYLLTKAYLQAFLKLQNLTSANRGWCSPGIMSIYYVETI